jgi:hypothetical protein
MGGQRVEPRELTELAAIALDATALASPAYARRPHARFRTHGDKQARDRDRPLCLSFVLGGTSILTSDTPARVRPRDRRQG